MELCLVPRWPACPPCSTDLQGGEHRGEIAATFFPSAERGWRRSGLRARRRRGDPAELGSADLGREKDFLVGVREEKGEPGEKVWVAWEAPGWWPRGSDRGEGERVGEEGRGEGEGVRAKGERGMCPTDFRLEGE